MPWPTPRTEPYWTIPAEAWAEARQQIARIAVPCRRQTLAALVDHLEAGWEIVSAIQVEADRMIHSRMRAPEVARDVAGFVECEPTDNYRYVVEMCLEAIPVENGRWVDAMQDVDGECEEIVRQVRMVYLATANPAFPPLLAAVVKDAYPRLAKWLRELPAVLRPVERLSEIGEAGRSIALR